MTDKEAPPSVTAVAFDSVTVDEWLGKNGVERDVYKVVELSNGRTLAIDDWGIIDQHDINPDRPVQEQRFFYLSWDELLAALDDQRKQGQN